MDDRHQSNRGAWNEAAASYRKGLDAEIGFLRGGGMTFRAPELRYLSPLKPTLGRCIHLQCAGGSDTLALINFGAREVVGLDISDEMIEVARAKSSALKVNATWVRADVLDAPPSLDGTADLVYTGKGALNWLMDIEAWARVVARLLKPGGVFYLFEGHPFTFVFDMNAAELKIDPTFQGYFSEEAYSSQDWPDTYVGKLKESVKDQAVKYERAWPLGRIVTALLKAGLTLEAFEEHPEGFWQEFPNLPEEMRRRIPNTFSVLARKRPG